MKGLFKGCWTIPNLLTFIRILLLPLFVYFFYQEKVLLAVLILFFSGLTDTLDGKIARRFNQISELGKILDPVADKLTQITIAVMLFLEFRKASNEIIRAFSWIFIFFLVKEAVMVLGGSLMLLVGIRPGAAEIYGKIATFFFYGSMLLIISFGPEIGAFVRNNKNPGLVLPDWALIGLVSVSAFLTLLAFLSYMPETLRQFKERGVELREKRKK
ncbi:MAG TPA: CDP-alcohol phosphatidyltransferase family protein [Clostridiales bacterium]|nr:CDP-alcohol phosphatidyltransferase family protein [Clostridiales bacterium]